jgi:hypothetical protein
VSERPDSEQFMARVEALLMRAETSLALGESQPLSPLGAGILVAVEMGLADSRGFARALGVEHALVLREVSLLSGEEGLITVTGRHPKTLRTSLGVSARGAGLLNSCRGSPGQDGVAA